VQVFNASKAFVISCIIAGIIGVYPLFATAEEAPLQPVVAQEAKPAEEVIYNEADFTDTVTLQFLNKVTARVSSLDISQGSTGTFGNLEIMLQRCWKSPPQQDPENKALLKISERVPGEDIKQIFNGWMFSSTPALSALEHPVYDVTVIACKNKADKSAEPKADEKKPGKKEPVKEEKKSELPVADNPEPKEENPDVENEPQPD
jgi:hypothetical protein